MSRYRLVAIDVDGTLIQRGAPVSPAVVAAIALAREQGVVVTLASGRMFPLVESLIHQLALTSPVICYGGAMVVEPEPRNTIYRRGVPLQLALEVIEAAHERELSARAYVGDRVFVDRMEPGRFNYDSLLRINAEEVGDLRSFLTDDPSHLAIDAPPEQTRELVLAMRQVFSPRLNVTTGHPLLTEFSHPSVHKGSAVRWLCDHLGIDPSQSLAIGDDWNDLDMLRLAGFGVAVANAHPDVLRMADAVVPSVEEDGVAVALERFVLNGA